MITDLTNVRYLTGFSGTNGQVLVNEQGVTFFSDGRYAARARNLVKEADIVIYETRLSQELGGRLPAGTRLGVEAGTMTLADHADLEKRLDSVTLVSTRGVVEELRRSKDQAELSSMREAIRLGDETFEWILGSLKAGRTERDVALELEVRMREGGAERVSFEPIVGSGELSAHIHHTPSDRELERGDLVLLDLGCCYEGYASDLTRTVVLGEATEQQKEIYDLVLRAQTAGIDALRAGASGKGVDARARAIIEDAGRGEAFAHGLGHGVGLDVHEAPRLHKASEDTLAEGDVVTVEPGVYLPDWGGIRIEDCVLVTSDGSEVLGSAPKDELIEL